MASREEDIRRGSVTDTGIPPAAGLEAEPPTGMVGAAPEPAEPDRASTTAARPRQEREPRDESARDAAGPGPDPGAGADAGTATLLRLGDSGLTVADPVEDVRGRKVVDRAGQEIGTVDDLLIDDRQHKVRFLRVAEGGVLGFGETHVLIPVDAVTRVTDNAVHVDQTREHVAGAPRYDPKLADVQYWGDLYGYYGYGPFWAPGYAYPAYPFYP